MSETPREPVRGNGCNDAGSVDPKAAPLAGRTTGIDAIRGAGLASQAPLNQAAGRFEVILRCRKLELVSGGPPPTSSVRSVPCENHDGICLHDARRGPRPGRSGHFMLIRLRGLARGIPPFLGNEKEEVTQRYASRTTVTVE